MGVSVCLPGVECLEDGALTNGTTARARGGQLYQGGVHLPQITEFGVDVGNFSFGPSFDLVACGLGVEAQSQ